MRRASFLLIVLVLIGALSFIQSSRDLQGSINQYPVAFSSGVRAAVQQELDTTEVTPLVATQVTPLAVTGEDSRVTINPLAQNEPSIAVNPKNPQNIVVGANDLALGFPWLGAYSSFDGGYSWTRGLINTTGVLGSFGAASDPSLAFDGNGSLYYVGLAFNIQLGTPVGGSVFVAKSSNGGLSFFQLVVVARGSSKIFHDKPYVAVDLSSGRVFVSWTRFGSTHADIMVSRSSDGGSSFSSPVKVSTSTTNQGSLPIVGPSGQVYVVWNDLTNDRISIAKSSNGGSTFSPPTVVSKYVPLPDCQPNCLANSKFRVNNNPAGVIDETNGNVYVSWADYGRGNSDILFSRSVDGGANWASPSRVNDDTTLNDQFFPCMAWAQGRLEVVFYDRRLDPENHLMDVFAASSDNGGLSFNPNVRVSDVSSNPDAVVFSDGESFIGDYIGAASDGGVAYAAWTDTRDVSATSPTDENIFLDILTGNFPPVLGPLADKTIGEGNMLSFEVSATDPDAGETLTFTSQALPPGASFSSIPSSDGNVTGDFSWTPTEEQGPGNYSVEIVASDGFSHSILRVSIMVEEVNSPPVLSVPGLETIDAGSTLTFVVSASDSDVPTNTVVLRCENCSVLGASFDGSSGRFTWTPTEEQGPGIYTVEFRALDNGVPVMSDTKDVTIQVSQVNRSPQLAPVPDKTVDEGSPLTFEVTAIDPDVPPQPLTFSLGSDAPPGASLSPNGGFSWTPTEIQGPATHKFTITVSDGLRSDSEMVTVKVNEVDNPPVLAVPGPQIVQQGGSVSFTVEATNPNVDPSGRSIGTFSVFASDLPEGATFNNATGVFLWTRSGGQRPGVYSVTFTGAMNGGGVVSESRTVKITVVQTGVTRALLTGPLGLAVALTPAGLAVLVSVLVIRRWRREDQSGAARDVSG